MRAAKTTTLVLLLGLPLPGQKPHREPPAIPEAPAARAFDRAHALCRADAGKLWGISLCVPMMLADPTTRQATTNVPVPGATRDGRIFRLTLAAGVPISDAPTEYADTRFAEIVWPMYGSADTQAVTLMHESFHIVQPKLGFTGYAGRGSISGDAALDTRTGRVWLRGELHALRAALQASGATRRSALGDALALRFYRHLLLRVTAEQERELDIMEGLAEGTGIDAGLPPSRRIPYALYDIGFVEAQPSYARSFPYATGPSYSELLDAVRPGWRHSIRPSSDLARMAMGAYGLHVAAPSASQAKMIIGRYGGAAIESEEAARAVRKAALIRKYKQELINGSTLILPMKNIHITFNPREIETFDPYGSVYHTLTVTALWGRITVAGGDAMISKDFRFVTVAAPSQITGSALRGNGWKLDLTVGYVIVPDPHKRGSYLVSAEPVPAHSLR